MSDGEKEAAENLFLSLASQLEALGVSEKAGNYLVKQYEAVLEGLENDPDHPGKLRSTIPLLTHGRIREKGGQKLYYEKKKYRFADRPYSEGIPWQSFDGQVKALVRKLIVPEKILAPLEDEFKQCLQDMAKHYSISALVKTHQSMQDEAKNIRNKRDNKRSRKDLNQLISYDEDFTEQLPVVALLMLQDVWSALSGKLDIHLFVRYFVREVVVVKKEEGDFMLNMIIMEPIFSFVYAYLRKGLNLALPQEIQLREHRQWSKEKELIAKMETYCNYVKSAEMMQKWGWWWFKLPSEDIKEMWFSEAEQKKQRKRRSIQELLRFFIV